MELAKGGEVFDRLLECGSLPELEAAKLLHQVDNYRSGSCQAALGR